MSAHGVSRGFGGGPNVFSPVRGDTLIHATRCKVLAQGEITYKDSQ